MSNEQIVDNEFTSLLNHMRKMKINGDMKGQIEPLKMPTLSSEDLMVGGNPTYKSEFSLNAPGIDSLPNNYNMNEIKFDAIKKAPNITNQPITNPINNPITIKTDDIPILKETLKEPVINPTTTEKVVIKPEAIPVIENKRTEKRQPPSFESWQETEPMNYDNPIENKINNDTKNIKRNPLASFLQVVSNIKENIFSRGPSVNNKIDIADKNPIGETILNDNQPQMVSFAKKHGVEVLFNKMNQLTQSITMSGAEKDVIFVQEHFKDALNMIGLTDVNQSVKKTGEEIRVSVANRLNQEFQFKLDDEHNLDFSAIGKLSDKAKFEFFEKIVLPQVSMMIKENVNLSFHINKLINNNQELTLLKKFAEFNSFENVDLVFNLLKESPEILKSKPGFDKLMEKRETIIEKYEKYNNLNENNLSALRELEQIVSNVKSIVSKLNVEDQKKKDMFKAFDEEIALNETFHKGKKVSSIKISVGDTLKNIEGIRQDSQLSSGIKIKMT